MTISGFAYTKDQDQIRSDRTERLNYLKGLGINEYIKITNSSVQHAKNVYTGYIESGFQEQLTLEDVAIVLDDHPVCPFGGAGDYDSETGKFYIIIYTD